tara:strand:- start:116 stop:541 length:426 start_codon:yes stop_codon:yes gene_type:complete
MIVTDIRILRKMSKEVFDKVSDKTIDEMKKVMEEHKGVGIAAIQVGKAIRVFLAGNPPQVFVNPKVINKSTYAKTDWEGCLSCPGAHVRVKRSHSITLEYQNEEGKIIRRKFKGFDARVIQHELDHLNGYLIIDRGKVYQE